jgi:hypothetical protein
MLARSMVFVPAVAFLLILSEPAPAQNKDPLNSKVVEFARKNVADSSWRATRSRPR